jgi:hypothetical protein
MQVLTLERYLRALFPGKELETPLKAYHDAAADLMKNPGMPLDLGALEEQEQNILRLQYALNDLGRVLVRQLGISEKD